MNEIFSRTALLMGEDAQKMLMRSRVAVFGLGGVGGHAAEALVRSGVGSLDIVDNDTVSLSNINRQLFATMQTVGMPKTEAARQRLLSVNPDVNVVVHNAFFSAETASEFDFSAYDYIIDAIDTVKAKIELVLQAKAHNVPIICSMGAGNKLHPELFEIADIYSTSVCPLARVMRTELKKCGIRKLKVVYSKENPITPTQCIREEGTSRRQIPGSVAFVPSVVGLILAGEVIRELAGIKN